MSIKKIEAEYGEENVVQMDEGDKEFGWGRNATQTAELPYYVHCGSAGWFANEMGEAVCSACFTPLERGEAGECRQCQSDWKAA